MFSEQTSPGERSCFKIAWRNLPKFSPIFSPGANLICSSICLSERSEMEEKPSGLFGIRNYLSFDKMRFISYCTIFLGGFINGWIKELNEVWELFFDCSRRIIRTVSSRRWNFHTRSIRFLASVCIHMCLCVCVYLWYETGFSNCTFKTKSIYSQWNVFDSQWTPSKVREPHKCQGLVKLINPETIQVPLYHHMTVRRTHCSHISLSTCCCRRCEITQ